MTRFIITQYHETAECDLSGRTDEAVEVTSDDNAFQASILSFPELKKQLRQRFRQEQRQNGHVPSPMDSEPDSENTFELT